MSSLSATDRTSTKFKVIVVAGGFTSEETVESSSSDVDIVRFQAKHEEADTRIILHCIETYTDNIVFQSRNTDVIMLLGHYHRMPCTKLWLKAGTAKKQQYIPVHAIVDQMPYNVKESIPAFHALTGSDTTSSATGKLGERRTDVGDIKECMKL